MTEYAGRLRIECPKDSTVLMPWQLRAFDADTGHEVGRRITRITMDCNTAGPVVAEVEMLVDADGQPTDRASLGDDGNVRLAVFPWAVASMSAQANKDEVTVTAADLQSLYRERAHLVAHLTHLYPSVLSWADVNEPDWSVLYIDTPVGQLSWHIAASDLDLFAHVPQVPPADPRARWDRHTTPEKYERLQRLHNTMDTEAV